MPTFDPKRPWKQWYNLAKWKRLAARQLARHPLCVRCTQVGRVEPATVVDHVVAHKGNVALFYDASNLQSMCIRCHNGWKQRVEHGSQGSDCDDKGYPLDGSW